MLTKPWIDCVTLCLSVCVWHYLIPRSVTKKISERLFPKIFQIATLIMPKVSWSSGKGGVSEKVRMHSDVKSEDFVELREKNGKKVMTRKKNNLVCTPARAIIGND